MEMNQLLYLMILIYLKYMEKKFEDLDDVIDASDLDKKITKGYHVCKSVILTEKEKQPISVYSKIGVSIDV